MPKTDGTNSTDEYTKEELFEIWRNFRDSPDEVSMLGDFALLDEHDTRQLIREFKGEPPEPEPFLDTPPFPTAPHEEPDF